MPQTLSSHARELIDRGYTIVPDVLTLSELETARSLLSQLWESEKVPATERGWHNKSWIISYMLPAKHAFFRDLALNPRVLPLMREVLGDNCILSSFNGMMMTPNGEKQKLHLDQPDHTPGLVININAMYCLDDYTLANGCTRLVPNSHNRPPGTKIDRDADEKSAIYIEAPATSLIAFNGGMVHAGSANTTPSPRRCLHTYYSRPWVRSQWDFVRSFDEKTKASLTPDQKQIFGFQAHEQIYDLETHTVTRG